MRRHGSRNTWRMGYRGRKADGPGLTGKGGQPEEAEEFKHQEVANGAGETANIHVPRSMIVVNFDGLQMTFST